jgi:hypothetical protein
MQTRDSLPIGALVTDRQHVEIHMPDCSGQQTPQCGKYLYVAFVRWNLTDGTLTFLPSIFTAPGLNDTAASFGRSGPRVMKLPVRWMVMLRFWACSSWVCGLPTDVNLAGDPSKRTRTLLPSITTRP